MAGELMLGFIAGKTVSFEYHACTINLLFQDTRMNDGRRLISMIGGVKGPFHERNRNDVVHAFLGSLSDWLLQIDTDMTFEPSDVYDLFDKAVASGHKIVSALCFTRIPVEGSDGPVLVPSWYDVDKDTYQFSPRLTLVPGMQEIEACGGACLLVHRSVFEEMKKRYTDDEWIWFARDLWKTPRGPERMGEDVSFCRRAKDCGFRIFGCADVIFGHVKERIETLETFMAEHGLTQVEEDRPVASIEKCALPLGGES